ncbi:MAG: hypothetical protein GYB64_12775 [Chloroflexi bacterium]|nr:hypothetical protein [Chloroflexota bacterium]
MELRALWKVVKRRWWLILLPAAAALIYAIYGVVTAPPAVGGYAVTMRFTAATPIEDAENYEDAALAPWTSSEYVVNGLVDWVGTSTFADEVNRELQGVEVPAGIFVADNERSVMTVTVAWGDDAELTRIAQAVRTVLRDRAVLYFPQLDQVEVTALDDVNVVPVPPPLTNRLDPLIRFGLGLAAGIALAFLVEYLDPTLRDRAEVEAMGLPVIAEVPRR